MAANNVKEIEGDTKRFAQIVLTLVQHREPLDTLKEGVSQQSGRSVSIPSPRQDKNFVSSGVERAELIVDIPVWSPGCFQGMSFGYHNVLIFFTRLVYFTSASRHHPGPHALDLEPSVDRSLDSRHIPSLSSFGSVLFTNGTSDDWMGLYPAVAFF